MPNERDDEECDAPIPSGFRCVSQGHDAQRTGRWLPKKYLPTTTTTTLIQNPNDFPKFEEFILPTSNFVLAPSYFCIFSFNFAP